MTVGRPRQFNLDSALDAALLLFWRQGYEGTSIADLTRVIGVNAPSLYAAFGNKEALFQQVLRRYLEQPASYLPRALEAPSARQAVERLFRGAIEMAMNPRHPDGCLLVQGALASGPSGEPVRLELARRRAGAEAMIRRRFERAVAERDLPRSAKPARLAKFVITVVWGLSVQASGGASRAELLDVARQALACWPGDQAVRLRRQKRVRRTRR